MKAGGHTEEITVPELEEWLRSGQTLNKYSQTWSDKDVAVLMKYYGKVPTRELAKSVGKTYDAVISKARRLGIPYNK